MSTVLPPVESLRRTRSTGDLPDDTQRPEQIRISASCRHSESDTPTNLTNGVSAIVVPGSDSDPQGSTTPSLPAIAPSRRSHSPSWPPTILSLPSLGDENRDTPPTLETHNDARRRRNRGWYSKTLAFFGYGRHGARDRRELVWMIWSMTWASSQIVAIIVIVTLSTILKSPTSPHLVEWHACNKPLGTWCCLWIFRAGLAILLAYWTWSRERAAIRRSDAESGNTSGINGPPAPIFANNATVGDGGPSTGSAGNATQPANAGDSYPRRSLLYSRLLVLHTMITFTWFVTAHILEYTTIYTCRLSSPHLWWLTFSILGVMYIKVLEIVFLGIAVFIVGPIIFLIWNLLLICLGRHPLQNPVAAIKPEVDKLPKAIIDAIPLVMYIPPPPDELSGESAALPENAHAYPPKPPPAKPKRRFRFLRRKTTQDKRKTDGSGSNEGDSSQKKEGGEIKWEDCWEPGAYPFVRLEGNRAACAICLLDFAEPKRVMGGPLPSDGGGDKAPGVASNAEDTADMTEEVQEIFVEQPLEDDRHIQLKLMDAGEGPQPLRLLQCGHVFHKTCLDPWLRDVSGRCPLCQRPVVTPEETPQRRRRRR